MERVATGLRYLGARTGSGPTFPGGRVVICEGPAVDGGRASYVRGLGGGMESCARCSATEQAPRAFANLFCCHSASGCYACFVSCCVLLLCFCVVSGFLGCFFAF